MIDNTDSTGMADTTSAFNSTDSGSGSVVAGADPGSWVGITGTLPSDLPPANTPGDPAVAAAMAAAAGSSSAPAGMSGSVKLALAIGAAAVIVGMLAVSSSPRRRR
jgi:hypothetical protein